MRSSSGLPAQLRQRDSFILRPRDATDIYAHPAPEFRRLAKLGLLQDLAHGYWAVVPADQTDKPSWRPSVEELALGIGATDYPADQAALMGLSAARHHGAAPRAHATAWLAVTVSRRPLDAGRFGHVSFVQRDTAELDLVRATTALVDGWVTSIEQTVVDLARRPSWAGGTEQATAAINRLWPHVNRDRLLHLAQRQRGLAPTQRLLDRIDASRSSPRQVRF